MKTRGVKAKPKEPSAVEADAAPMRPPPPRRRSSSSAGSRKPPIGSGGSKPKAKAPASSAAGPNPSIKEMVDKSKRIAAQIILLKHAQVRRGRGQGRGERRCEWGGERRGGKQG